ncbi:hypothetical protein CONPUDRAFT_153085 [Coniophora puteana RWD-64-598 SS2]|uniref:Uncharacterized protein n=1 Tax=Coniophora puteana (strain RWD-64-598) TaxID=741705 RepID=A0A5M3MT27_CONPW|nr:uncharacterized protein CONPUDRAFT_153085 [Coniophora puteana RWD-64-598 SS2]EIW82197.1 hypothetical protein CONPUDRAFT_153085 [Coniophora puteana RWD-64-598 SS2]
MRVQHTSHSFPAFPVFSSAFVADNELVVGGGGGASRTGIKNRLRLYRVSDDRNLDLLGERELDKDEDAPMSMAALQKNKTFVCGINSSAQKISTGQNDNCRVFAIEGAEHTEDDYQKVAVLSPDGTLVAVAGERDFALLSYPLLNPVASPIHLANGGIYDSSFTDDRVILVTSQNILVYALPDPVSSTSPPPSPSPNSKSKKKGKQKNKSSPTASSSSSLSPNGASSSSSTSTAELELLQTLGVPALPTTPKGSTVIFRAARFRPGAPDTLHAVLNVTLPRAPRAKVAKRQTYVGVWKLKKKGEGEKEDSGEVWEMVKNRKVGEGAATCFDVSADGKFFGLGFQDYSVGVFDSQSLLPLCSVLKAHEFAITTLRFSPTSRLLVSASADNTLRVISIPENLGQQTWTMTIIIILTVIIILLAMALAKP